MLRLPDGSVDMILCDLPYGTTQNAWDSVLPLEDYIDIKIKSRTQRMRMTKNAYTTYCFERGISLDECRDTWAKSQQTGL